MAREVLQRMESRRLAGEDDSRMHDQADEWADSNSELEAEEEEEEEEDDELSSNEDIHETQHEKPKESEEAALLPA